MIIFSTVIDSPEIFYSLCDFGFVRYLSWFMQIPAIDSVLIAEQQARLFMFFFLIFSLDAYHLVNE
jgi:hypothetical protein